MRRILYAILGFFEHYQALKRVRRIQSIDDLTPEFFYSSNIKVLVLDFDGVLSAHGEPEPNSFARSWLSKQLEESKLEKIFILTNNPQVERERFFEAHFPQILFVSSGRKKPYPDGLLSVIEKNQVLPQEVALIDDRLLTGMLAAQKAGVKGFWVTHPFMNFRKCPIKEMGFFLLRWLEKILIF
jgi:predicted HAD superfamily phosphohydrolase YqeG